MPIGEIFGFASYPVACTRLRENAIRYTSIRMVGGFVSCFGDSSTSLIDDPSVFAV